MTRKFVSAITFITLIVLSGCNMPLSSGPTDMPTAVPQMVGSATPQGPAPVMPTSVEQTVVANATKTAVPPAKPTTQAQPQPTTKPPVQATTQPPAPLPTQPSVTVYIVKSGDWLWKIARETGVAPHAIAEANPGLDVTNLTPGQRLNIPRGSTPPQATPVPPTGQTIHIVQPGETLYRIALKYNKSWQEVATANGITNPASIQPGQRLVIP
jgi:LysM repeat protein